MGSHFQQRPLEPFPLQVPGQWKNTWSTGRGSSRCAKRLDGSAFCWGLTGGGPLPQSIGNSVTVPTLLHGAWDDMDMGVFTNCGRIDGELYCWPKNDRWTDSEPLAGGPTESMRVMSGPWGSYSVGEHHVCGIRLPGTMWCWGNTDSGALGNPSTTVTTSKATFNFFSGARVCPANAGA